MIIVLGVRNIGFRLYAPVLGIQEFCSCQNALMLLASSMRLG